jgi:uncharacterized membrane protein
MARQEEPRLDGPSPFPLCACGLPVHLLPSTDRSEAPAGYCGVTLGLNPVVVITQCVAYIVGSGRA